ncbi:MAG TPA: copper resistance CopC family protein [Methylocystis sp.]|nr:copper resistance CopC family protein [Methylocystis sp.]
MTTIRGALAALALTLLLSPGAALAHAIVVASNPEPRQTVKGPDISVEIRFNSRIDLERSRLTLKRPDGSSVILPLQGGETGDMLRSGASGLTEGSHTLLWQTLSVDGHITHGVIPFEVSR